MSFRPVLTKIRPPVKNSLASEKLEIACCRTLEKSMSFVTLHFSARYVCYPREGNKTETMVNFRKGFGWIFSGALSGHHSVPDVLKKFEGR
jgi:hypothetical protein